MHFGVISGKILGSNQLFRLCGDRTRARRMRAAPTAAERRLQFFGGPQGRPWKDFRERDGTGVVYGKNLFCQDIELCM